MSRKLVVVGLDGADWRIIEPLLAEGCLPNLKKMYDRGSHARLRSTIPHLTAPSWTTIFTGVNPGKHGIFSFTKPRGRKIEPTSSRDNACPYVWEMMDGKRVIAFNIPCSYPPRGVPGSIVVSGFATPEESSAFTYPADVKAEIMRVAPDYNFGMSISVLEAIRDELASADPNAKETGKPEDRRAKIADSILENLQTKKKTASYLLATKPWDLAIIVFSAPDWAQHKFMHPFVEAERKGDTVIGRVYRSIDEYLGTLIRENHDVLIVSDHGFEPLRTFYYLNTFLLRSGLLKLKNKNPLRSLFQKTGLTREQIIRLIPLPLFRMIYNSRFASNLGRSVTASNQVSTEEIDLERSEAYFLYPGLYVKPGKSRKAIMEMMEACVDKDGAKVLSGIPAREDIYSGPKRDDAPDMLPHPAEGVSLLTAIHLSPSSPLSRDVVSGVDKEGGHSEYGIFLAYGPAFEGKGRIADLSVADITPTMLAYHGYERPSHMDGLCVPVLAFAPGQGLKASSGIKHQTRMAIRGLAGRMAGGKTDG